MLDKSAKLTSLKTGQEENLEANEFHLSYWSGKAPSSLDRSA